ncbi:DUF6221 family protein [Streptomyces sp. NPDC102415]|uniref:DUF6221 family protein n=1 Tax=Streptomyces sp. NPDC102415 TaxID=3366173 RepID=UPI0037F3E535
MTAALVAFLKARLDEDREGALRWHDLECDFHRQSQGGILPAIATAQMLADVPGAVCDCGGPARSLREVEAKRRIVERHSPHSMGGCRTCERPHWGVEVCDHCERETPCPDLRDFAAVYADHPDYLPEWRP